MGQHWASAASVICNEISFIGAIASEATVGAAAEKLNLITEGWGDITPFSSVICLGFDVKWNGK